MRHLLLKLEGPLMSFGDVAIDSRLPVSRFPAHSMVCGILANAMGLCRTRPHEIQELQGAMTIASRLDRPGQRLRDFQTAQIGFKDQAWTTRGVLATRSGREDSYDNPNILEKDYWADASVTVAVSLPENRIDAVAESLTHPYRPIFLGRASCPPSCEILVGTVDAENVLDALRRHPSDKRYIRSMEAQWPEGLGGDGTVTYVSDLKDWTNRIHVGTRAVRQGSINVEACK